ncbi:uncharacterized protein LOC101768278 [Setaria italica]|uniref:uncharacterized protein LOC101768278 n=1 Tax=Setaria italica TaxID=4555 RepID=UPI0006456262|nr:uncharacterized protein LOC101768278 [Setaria italica]
MQPQEPAVEAQNMQLDNYLPEFLHPIQPAQEAGPDNMPNNDFNLNMFRVESLSNSVADPGWADWLREGKKARNTSPNLQQLWDRFFTVDSSPEKQLATRPRKKSQLLHDVTSAIIKLKKTQEEFAKEKAYSSKLQMRFDSVTTERWNEIAKHNEEKDKRMKKNRDLAAKNRELEVHLMQEQSSLVDWTNGVYRLTEELQQMKEAYEELQSTHDKETSEKNKLNRGKVKYHQTTGSRSYVAHLHAYKHQRNNAEPSTDTHEELDVVEAFTSCHTSSKHGLSEPAREVVLSDAAALAIGNKHADQADHVLTNMEALRAQPVAEGETRVSSVQVVSQVLPKNSSNSFLKSVGIKPVGTSQASSSSNEIELREQLAAEAKAAVQDELEDLKKRSEEAEEKLARTERELEEMKKLTEINTKAMEENNALLKRCGVTGNCLLLLLQALALQEVVVIDENYTINDDLRACGLPGDDEDDMAAGAMALFDSSTTLINVDAADAEGFGETEAFVEYIQRVHNPRFVKVSRQTTSRDLTNLTGRVIEEWCQRLLSKTVEMLTCLKDWELGDASPQHDVEKEINELEETYKSPYPDQDEGQANQ